MEKYYTLILLSNTNDEGKKLLTEQGDMYLLCSCTENFINNLVSDATNTFCTKRVKEVITGTMIYPIPEDKILSTLPSRLEYDMYPQTFKLTDEEAKQSLSEKAATISKNIKKTEKLRTNMKG